MLNVVAFESVRNQWSISRPMLGLILSSSEGYEMSKRRIVDGLPYHKQAQVEACFDALLVGVDLKSLGSKNRDKFTQRLTEVCLVVMAAERVILCFCVCVAVCVRACVLGESDYLCLCVG